MPRIAYKYRANSKMEADGTRLDINTLLSHQLYAAPLNSLNDPFEASVELPPDDIRGNEWVIAVKQSIYSAGIFSLFKPSDGESFPSNELMWSHYADSHKGFCIEYDLDVLCPITSKTFDLISTANINYQSNRPVVTNRDNLDVIIHKVFGTKSKAWEYENEIRLVFGNSGLKPVPVNAIKAIYFGLRMDLKERKQIIEGLRNEVIDFFQIEQIGNTYQLKATKLMFTFDYEIVEEEHLPRVDNYTILYKSSNKDRSTISEFVAEFRKNRTKGTNITIIDDIRVIDIIDRNRNTWTPTESDIISKHWIAFSSFDAPNSIWMYPEK